MRFKEAIKQLNGTYVVTSVCPYCAYETDYDSIKDLDKFKRIVLPIIACRRCHKCNTDSGLQEDGVMTA